jgi:uncharacterized protein (DUF697 family)
MDKELIQRLAEKEINKSAILAAGCGAIPTPYLDVAGTIALQMNMVKNLCELYEVEWNEHIGKGLIGAVLGNIGKRTVASMVKSVPIIGTAIGGFANATLSYASTVAMGKTFMKYMDVNKTVKNVKDIDLGIFSDMYKGFSSQATSFTEAIKKKMGAGQSESKQPETLTAFGERSFGSKANFEAWLQKPNSLLEGGKPINLLFSTKTEDHDKLRRLIELNAEKSEVA